MAWLGVLTAQEAKQEANFRREILANPILQKFETILYLIKDYQQNRLIGTAIAPDPNDFMLLDQVVPTIIKNYLESERFGFVVTSTPVSPPAIPGLPYSTTWIRITKISWETPTNMATRTRIIYSATAHAAGLTTVQTPITLTRSSGISATSTGVSFLIPAGKTFRIEALSVASRGHATATAQTTTFNIRINTTGGVVITSVPVLLSVRSATPAVASAWDRVIVPVLDGLEIAGDGTMQWGITGAATYITNAPTWDVLVIGYEY